MLTVTILTKVTLPEEMSLIQTFDSFVNLWQDVIILLGKILLFFIKPLWPQCSYHCCCARVGQLCLHDG